MLTKEPVWRTLTKENLLNSYKPLADYAIIGDTKTCALVGIDGSIDWLCVPRFDSPSVFAAILDASKGGSFRILPSEDKFESNQSYDGPTNILLTEFRSKKGNVTVCDFMPCFEVAGKIVSSGEIHRRLKCTRGGLDLDLKVEPKMDYGRIVPKITKVGSNGYSIVEDKTRQGLSLIAPFEFDISGEGYLSRTLKFNEGDQVDLVLRFNGLEYYHSQDTRTEEKLNETRSYWRMVASRCSYHGRWKEYVIRSALTLHLLIYSPTGAIIAAPTTSLPEKIGGQRNWDYRYSWIRDSSFVLWAFHSIGDVRDQSSYLGWLISTFYLTIQNLQVMLGVDGKRNLSESTLDNLEGYMKSSPVRIGNGAWNQLQLDVYGVLVDALYFANKHHKKLSKKVYSHIVRPIIKQVESNWEKPDCGIWEVRGRQEHFVYSKMWCWVAVDRAISIADGLGMIQDASDWKKLRETIRESIYQRGWDEKSMSFVRSFDSSDLDCANLLMPQVKFIRGDDPKMVATIDRIMENLLSGEKFLYRYRSEDGLPGVEGAFLICSFWLVSCLALAGRKEEAERLLEGLLECSNHVGLFSEEVDPESGALLGNFPQAFTHMGLISAVMNLGDFGLSP